MDGRGTLRITTRLDHDDLVVEFGDSGAGMPPRSCGARVRALLYDEESVGKGTGLGLDISRRIVADRHHGQIEIDSKPGHTVIRVRLPCNAR